MNCAEFESVLADYLDGALAESLRTELESHAAHCSACSAFMREVTGGLALIGQVEDSNPPQELITRIAYQIPRGKFRSEFESSSFWRNWKIRWIEPLLQPRLAMGMAMTVLSFSMLARCTGVPAQHIQAADLNPMHIAATAETRFLRAKDRLLKNYENLRVVYEIESRLNDMETQNAAPDAGKQQTNKPGNSKGTQK